MSDLARSAAFHKALSHPVRLRLVAALREGPLCVCQLTVVVEQASSTVSSHLAALKGAGVLRESKDGRFVSYRWPETGPERRRLVDVVARLGRDPQVEADAQLVRELRRVGPDALCQAELNLSRVGIRRPRRVVAP